ncbi:MAG: AlpA family phage regulatory protein [Desulfovibrio sp.]|nr:AlpA family phage regulatory protein [Desulfovibrio sp.]
MLRVDEIVKRYKVSRSKLYRLIKNGEFPKPIKCGRISLWYKAEVDAYFANLPRFNG